MDDSLSARLNNALNVLGYTSFREGQENAILTLLKVKRLLLVAPTGGGKSLCYQLPAYLLDGVTLVISPLIALMHDQVKSCLQRGLNSTFLASTLSSRENHQRLDGLCRGDFKLCYISPERLLCPRFLTVLQELHPTLFAVDEAHCISEWGHDFRPEYARIGEILKQFTQAHILACTATATPIVRDEIMKRLGLPADTPQIVRGFSRPNLAMHVVNIAQAKERALGVDRILQETLHMPGAQRGCVMIYGSTRKSCEDEYIRLKKQHWAVGCYHAGLTAKERERTQRCFSHRELEVIVATNAFGMGIDRADVRAVIHLSPPHSLESYYQEIGRAGRDGKPAKAWLFLADQDLPLKRGILKKQAEHGPCAVAEHKWQLFLELLRWAEGGSCRHDAILRYFGDNSATLRGCGICDVCQNLDHQSPSDGLDVAIEVQKALSGIARIHGRFGMGMAVKLLKGQEDVRLKRARLEQVKTFGVLKERPVRYLFELLRRLVVAGWADFVGAPRPMMVLTQQGFQVMQGKRPARVMLPKLCPEYAKPVCHTPKSGKKVENFSLGMHHVSEKTFEMLRAARSQLAIRCEMSPYQIMSDTVLKQIAEMQPRNLTELKQIQGLSAFSLERFGPALLALWSQMQKTG